jgi:hypothetical protein
VSCSGALLASIVQVRAVLNGSSPVRSVQVLRRFAVEGCAVWFLKFSLHLPDLMLAVGGTTGKVTLWPMPGAPTHEAGLERAGTKRGNGQEVVNVLGKGQQCTVRSVAMSDGGTLVAGLDDGRIVVLRRRCG